MLSDDNYRIFYPDDSPTRQEQHGQQQLISVEEGMDCRQANSRFFSMRNLQSRLNVIISLNSAILSCKLDGLEIVLDNLRQLRQSHEAWALGERPYQKLEALPWNCHVRGCQLLLSTSSNGASSIVYELSRQNELHSTAKLKSVHLQHQVAYFNLNCAPDKRPINGHTLVVQCNGNLNRIRAQSTKLLCQCNQRAPVLPQSLVGDVPFELVQHGAATNEAASPQAADNPDDVIVCDSIYSLESSSPADYLRVRLQYKERALEFELRSAPSSNPQHQQQAGSDHSVAAAAAASSTVHSSASIGSVSSSTLSSVLRARVRVTNFGVSIQPIMMAAYASTYRFVW